MTFEMIPTVLRAQGGAMATSLGMALSFCAPYIAFSVSCFQICFCQSCSVDSQSGLPNLILEATKNNGIKRYTNSLF